MEKTLQYLSRPMRKSFYFQSKVSVWRAVLHGQTLYQHCDSSMQYNLQDQRFQKILMSAHRHHLKSSLPLRQHKLKFSECILKLGIPPWLSMAAYAAPGKPLPPPPASVLSLLRPHWGCPRMGPRSWFTRRAEFPSAGSSCAVLFLPCWHITGVPQGREKQARERSACLRQLKHLYNI